jgi:Na+-driven multidrug efflux pump
MIFIRKFTWELSAFEIITILSGYLSIQSIAAHIIILNTNILLYMIPAGIMASISAIIGREFG